MKESALNLMHLDVRKTIVGTEPDPLRGAVISGGMPEYLTDAKFIKLICPKHALRNLYCLLKHASLLLSKMKKVRKHGNAKKNGSKRIQ